MLSLTPQTKLRMTALLLRATAVAYAMWVLWRILSWWLNTAEVAKGMGRFLNRDLSAMSAWQSYACLGLDIAAWAFLMAAVLYSWQFLSNLQRTLAFTPTGAKQLMRCAQTGLICQAATLLSNPFKTFLLTSHLSRDQQLWYWGLAPSAVLGVILCLALLMFALVYVWALEIADENKGFV
jgi:hypothetical protein